VQAKTTQLDSGRPNTVTHIAENTGDKKKRYSIPGFEVEHPLPTICLLHGKMDEP